MPDNLDTPYHVHEQDEDGNLGTYVGGAHDEATATMIATAFYVSVQAAYQDSGRIIVVVDDNGAIKSWIGKNPTQAGG